MAALRKNFPEDCISGNGRSQLSALQVLEPTWSKDAACGPLEAPKSSPRWLHIGVPAVAQLKEPLSSLERKTCSVLLPPIQFTRQRLICNCKSVTTIRPTPCQIGALQPLPTEWYSQACLASLLPAPTCPNRFLTGSSTAVQSYKLLHPQYRGSAAPVSRTQ